MKEDNLQLFVDIIKNYFLQLNGEDVEIDTPYLLENNAPKVLDLTGVIGISGATKGMVYFTAERLLVTKMLRMMGESNLSKDNQVDLVGEVANTIAGNARVKFGNEFHISVPFVITGSPQDIRLPKDEYSFVFPITWQNHQGTIVVCLVDL